MVRHLLALAVVVFSQVVFGADTLFEGYYKVTSGDQHIGFNILRYQFDPAGKKFLLQQLTRVSVAGTDSMESLVATSDETLNPISYKYTTIAGKVTKTIDAKFSKGKMTATVTESGKKNITIKNDVKPGTFIGIFMVYTMLRSPTGIQTGSSFSYDAVAEEDGMIVKGTAVVKKEEKYKGFSAFRIENNFKGSDYIAYVTDKGEYLATEVKGARLSSELVAKPADAIGTIGMPESVAKTIFGSIPSGSKNIVTEYFNKMEKKMPDLLDKQKDYPAGQGIQLKAQPSKKKEGP